MSEYRSLSKALAENWLADFLMKPMEKEAAAVGQWQNQYTDRSHPHLQILTLAELSQGKRPNIPWVDASVMKSAKREDTSRQGSLL